MSVVTNQPPLKLAEGLDRQARAAREAAGGDFMPQTLGACSNALRLASATIKALVAQIPDHNQEPTKSAIYHTMCANLAPE